MLLVLHAVSYNMSLLLKNIYLFARQRYRRRGERKVGRVGEGERERKREWIFHSLPNGCKVGTGLDQSPIWELLPGLSCGCRAQSTQAIFCCFTRCISSTRSGIARTQSSANMDANLTVAVSSICHNASPIQLSSFFFLPLAKSCKEFLKHPARVPPLPHPTHGSTAALLTVHYRLVSVCTSVPWAFQEFAFLLGVFCSVSYRGPPITNSHTHCTH